jgi:hypothetical protein
MQLNEGIGFMATELLAELMTAKAERDKSRQDVFRGLLKRLVAGEKVPTAQVLDTLEKCGRTPEELARLVDLVNRRTQWAESLRLAAEAEKTIAECDELLAAEAAEWRTLEEEHQARRYPITSRREQAVQRISEAMTARQSLIQSASAPDISAEVEQAEAAQWEAWAVAQKLAKDLEEKQELLSKVNALIEKETQRGVTLQQLSYEVATQEELPGLIEALTQQHKAAVEKARQLEEKAKAISEKRLDPLAV